MLQSLQKLATICKSLQKLVKVCKNSQKFSTITVKKVNKMTFQQTFERVNVVDCPDGLRDGVPND